MPAHPHQRSAIAARLFAILLIGLLLLIGGFGALAVWGYEELLAALARQSPETLSWPLIETLILDQARRLAPFALGLLALVLLVCHLLVRWAVDPLTQLAAALGGVRARLPVRAGGEVGLIARRFGELSSALQSANRAREEQERLLSDWQQRFERLLQAGHELDPTLDETTLLRRATGLLCGSLGYQCAAAAVTEDEQIVYYVSRGGEPEPPLRIPHTQAVLASQVLRDCRSLRIGDFGQSPLGPPSPGLDQPRAELAVPVRSGGQVLAVLLVQSAQPGAFTDADEQQLDTLARLLAGALSSAQRFQAEQVRRQLAEAIYHLSQTISAALTSGRIADLILDQLAQVLPYDRSALLLVDGARLELLAARGYPREQIRPGQRLALEDQPLLGALLAQRQPQTLVAPQRDRRYRPLLGGPPAQSWLAAPLLRQDTVVGLLVLESNQPRRYGPEALRAIGAVASQTAIALESARLYAAAQDHTQRLEVIASVTNVISTRDVARELPGILRTIIHQMRRVVPCDYAAVALANEDDQTFTLETVYDYAVRDWSQLPAGQRVPADRTPWQSACRTGSPMRQSDLRQSPFAQDQRLAGHGLRSGIVVPIIGQSRAFGALSFASRRADAYGDVQVATLLELSLYLGPVLHNARLAREREETAVKLARTQEHLNLVDKVRTVGQLAAGVAHDFNNLLAGILGNVQLLLLEAQEGEQQEMLQIIERAARDGSETVRRLQGFARIEHDSPMTEVRMDMVARDAIDITRPRWRDVAHSRGVSIAIDRRLDPVTPIAGRPAELREVLTNLIINAVDAMPEGGTLTVRTYDDPVAGETVVEVRDTGVGMPPEVRARVFDPFFTTKGEHGTGLGLAVSIGIVQGHGGKIELESSVGQGTRFMVRLPLRSITYAPPEHDRKDLDMPPAQILLVESEGMIRTATARLLRRWGHQISDASGGIEALQMFQPGAYDLVLSDLGMPDMNGWELLQQIKRRDPEVLTVLMTGWGRQATQEEARARGVDFIVEKPFDQATLREVLSEALVRRGA
jgi:signal transduction histidine kinase